MSSTDRPGSDQEDATQSGDQELRIVDNPETHRYEALLGGQLAGFSQYVPAPGALVFTHTEVDPSLEGRGIGSRLARGILDDVRARGLRLTPRCPFIAAYIRSHPAYADLVVWPERPAP